MNEEKKNIKYTLQSKKQIAREEEQYKVIINAYTDTTHCDKE